LTQASKPASLQIKSRSALKFDNKLKLAKRKQETADTKKSAKKQEADPQIEHPESLKNRLTRIGAEADPHSLIMAKERAKFLESPTNTGYASRESPAARPKEILMMSLMKNYQFFLL
jgi:hypothetical protein